MLSLIWTAISGNRLISYGIAVLSLLGVTALLLRIVFNAGKSSALYKQLADSLSSLQKEYKRRAEIDALSAADARRQLRDRWSSH